jgi:predicted Zn-dependent protease
VGGAPTSAPTDPNEKVVKLPAIIIPNLPGLSAAAEIKIGADLNKVILAYHGDDQRNPRLLAVREAAQPIIDMRVRKEVPITITIIDSNEVTAFSHLGGYIYLSKGLVNLAATEAEYQFVVGHEVAHIDLRHSLKAVDEVMRAGVAPDTGTLQYFYHQIAVGYGEARELEADDWVVERMYKLTQSERACRAFLERLSRYAKENNFENGNVPPKTDLSSPTQDVDNAIRALPAASLRKKHIDDRLRILSPAAAVPALKPK